MDSSLRKSTNLKIYVNKFGCPPEYVADMLRDIADALTSVHPQSEGDCSCS